MFNFSDFFLTLHFFEDLIKSSTDPHHPYIQYTREISLTCSESPHEDHSQKKSSPNMFRSDASAVGLAAPRCRGGRSSLNCHSAREKDCPIFFIPQVYLMMGVIDSNILQIRMLRWKLHDANSESRMRKAKLGQVFMF